CTQVEGSEWWKGRMREGREGWFPKKWVQVLERRKPVEGARNPSGEFVCAGCLCVFARFMCLAILVCLLDVSVCDVLYCVHCRIYPFPP
ncbi:hypothetical protein BD413DRAFT_599817, partial [Trametes elegans]